MDAIKMKVKVPTQLCVRKGPGLEYEIATALDNKVIVEVSEELNGWYKIQALWTKDIKVRYPVHATAWVCGEYLRKFRGCKLFG